MRITIIGTGYVGLVTGAGLAEMGNDVTCVDVDEERIAVLNDARAPKLPFYEPGLPELVRRNRARLTFTTDLADALEVSPEVVFVCVGTPPAQDGSADLSVVEEVVAEVATLLKAHQDHLAAVSLPAIAVKSTVPPGTGDRDGGGGRDGPRRAKCLAVLFPLFRF